MFAGRSHPQAGQGIEQVLNRPLAQAFGAGEDIAAMSQGRHGAQESHGSAGVAQINRRIRHLEIPAHPLDLTDGPLPVNAAAQLPERLGRVGRIFGPEQILRVLRPAANPAAMRARWLKLLEPGRVMTASMVVNGKNFFLHKNYCLW